MLIQFSFKFFIIIISLFLLTRASFADPKQIDKIRSFYKKNNLDFFGDLISHGRNLEEDEQKRAKIELLADDARVKALEQLEKLLKTAKGPMQAELLIRKATLFADRARSATYFLNNPFKTSRIKDPKFYLEQSIKTFKLAEQSHPTHPKMDVVLFSIAYNFGELRKIDESFSYYSKMVSRHPNSPLVGDARLALAEIHFDKRKFKNALDELKLIVETNHARLKNFALYKMAWVYFNLSDVDQAIDKLEKVIDGVNSSAVQNARLELRKEALSDLVAFYTERNLTEAAPKAYEYFNKIAATPDQILKEMATARAKRLGAYEEKKQAIPDDDKESFRLSEPEELLLKLVSIYRDQGKHEGVITVSQALTSKLELHPRIISLYRVRAESYEKMRKRDAVLNELRALANLAKKHVPSIKEELNESTFQNMKTYFQSFKEKISIKNEIVKNDLKLDESKQKDSEKVLLKVSFETLRDFAAFFHGEWTKTSSNQTLNQALETYSLGIESSLSPWRGWKIEDSFKLVENRAGLYYASGKFEESTKDYKWLVAHVFDEKERMAFVKNEISSIEQAIKKYPTQKKSDSLDPLHTALLDSYNRYLALHFERTIENSTDKKQIEEVANVLVTSARLLKDHQIAEESLDRMKAYTLHFPKEKDGFSVIRDILSLLEKTSRYEELKNFSELLLDRKLYTKTEVETDLKQSYEFASLKILEQLEHDKNWSKAVNAFAEFAEKNPQSKFVAQALMKSANAAIEIKDPELMLERLEKATTAKDPSIQKEAWLALEPLYRKAFDFEKLKTTYTEIAKHTTDKKAKAPTEKNLAEIEKIESSHFDKDYSFFPSNDVTVRGWIQTANSINTKLRTYGELRFLKSNNNPANNFKKKADLQNTLINDIEKLVKKAPDTLKSAAEIWSISVKALVLLEFADTMQTAAIPQVLAKASEDDKKAYTNALQNQIDELKGQALKLVSNALEAAPKVEDPTMLFADKLNQALAGLGEKKALSSGDFIKVWNSTPFKFADHKKPKEIDLEKRHKLTLQLLKANKDNFEKDKFEIAEYYFDRGQFGKAYSIFQDLLDAKREISLETKRKILAIELTKINANQIKSYAVVQNDPDFKWNMARYLARQKIELEKLGEDKENLKWFDEATAALLKSKIGEKVELAAGL